MVAMPPKSPLPPRHGLQAAWVRTLDRGAPAPWATMREFLLDKLGPGRDSVDPMLARGDFVDEHGVPWRGDEPYRPNTFVWFHRELRPEAEVPGTLEVLHRDERIVVFDKPHFLSTIRGDGMCCRAPSSGDGRRRACRSCRRRIVSTAARLGCC